MFEERPNDIFGLEYVCQRCGYVRDVMHPLDTERSGDFVGQYFDSCGFDYVSQLRHMWRSISYFLFFEATPHSLQRE